MSEKKCEIINRILSKRNIIIYILLASNLILLFIRSLFSNGVFLQDNLFYKLQNDWGNDFFVFLSESALNKEVYLKDSVSFNPPLLRLFMFIFYYMIPQSVSENYIEGALDPTQQDIRMQFSAMMGFLIMLIVSIIIIDKCILKLMDNRKKVECSIAELLILFSIGIINAVERGNLIIVSFAFCLLFFVNYKNDNLISQFIAIISLGIASGIKVYPILFCLCYVKEKQYKKFLLSGFTNVLLLFGPFVYYGGINGIVGFISSLFVGNASRSRVGTLNFSSLQWTIGRLLDIPEDVVQKYAFISKKLCLFILLFLILDFLKNEVEWKYCMDLVLIIILFTGTSHTYMLCFFIIPFILYLNEHPIGWRDLVYSLLFIVLISPIPLSTGNYICGLRLESERFTTLMIIEQFAVILWVLTFLISMIANKNKYLKKTK